MRLTVVGCSGSFAGPESPASCYLVTAENTDALTGQVRQWRVAFDLGAGAFGALQRHLEPGQLDAVVLSHLHPDHCIDVCGYNVYLKYHPDQAFRPIPVYGPQASAIRLSTAYDPHRPADFTGQFDFRPLRSGTPFAVGPITVTPAAVLHPTPEAFGFRIEGPTSGDDVSQQAVLTYTGDTDDCPGVREIATDADVLLSEAAFVEGRDKTRDIHLTGRRAGNIAKASGAQQLLLTHIPPWNPPDAAAREASGSYDGPISTASSGLTVEL